MDTPMREKKKLLRLPQISKVEILQIAVLGAYG